jgi:hypothetical protein
VSPRFARRLASARSSPRAEVTALDVCYLTDLRFPGGTSTSLATEIRAAYQAGYRVGVMQIDSVRLRHDRMTHPLLQTCLDAGEAIRILPGEPVQARLTLVRHPYVLARSLGGRLPLNTEQVIVICGQVPVDGDGRVLYSPTEVQANCEEATGHAPTWWPVSGRVRTALAESDVPLASEDWVETIDIAAWPVVETQTSSTDLSRSDTPPRRYVIGRHGRDDPMKWPVDPDVIRSVYPEADDIEVRILGGATHAIDRLGISPANWTVLGYGAKPSSTFLAELDAFVYYPHPDLIEAFGRNVLEALASGVVSIAPPQIAEAFHGACLAAEPADALPTLRAVWADPTRWASLAAAGRQIVEEHFSTDVLSSRLTFLCGAPMGRTRSRAAADLKLVPAGLRSQRPVILFTLLGVGTPAVKKALRTLAAARDREGGFHPVLVINGPRPALAQNLGITCASITGKRTWQGEGSWPEYVRRRLRQLASTHHADSVVPYDPTSPIAWISLGALIGRSNDDEPRAPVSPEADGDTGEEQPLPD